MLEPVKSLFKFLRHLNWLEFVRRLYDKFHATDVLGRSANVGFYFSFAFFPLLFFLISLFGLVLDSTENLRGELFRYLGQVMPRSAYELVHTTVEEVIENSSGGKLTVGLLVTLWSASVGATSIRNAMNAVYELKETRPWWQTRLQSLVLTLIFILLMAFGLVVVTIGWEAVETAIDAMGIEVASGWILNLIEWSVVILLMLLVTSVVYSWVPNFKKFHWYWISPGALVAIVLWIAFTSGFRLYLQYFNTYNKTYGSLGAVIILMLWMYLTGMAIILGGVINSVLTDMYAEAVSEETEATKANARYNR